MRIYADTSVFGGVFDEEFAEATQKLFSEIDAVMTTMVREPECVVLKRRGAEHVTKFRFPDPHGIVNGTWTGCFDPVGVHGGMILLPPLLQIMQIRCQSAFHKNMVFP